MTLRRSLLFAGLLTGAFFVPAAWAGQEVTPTDQQGNYLPFLGSAATMREVPGDTTIAAGGAPQTLFGGTVPINRWAVYNPSASADLWCSDSTTAAVNGSGSIRVAANGGGYESPPGMKPFGPVSCVGGTTGQPVTARRW